MYVLGSVLGGLVKAAMSLGVVAFLTAPRGRKKSEQERSGLRDVSIELAKVVTSVIVGALLSSWYERKKREQQKQALAELRQTIREDVLLALSQWSAQGQLTIETDERNGEILAVSSVGES